MARRRRPPRPGALADLSPSRIFTQILLLQLSYYAVAAVLISFTVIVAGGRPSVDLILNWRLLRSDVTTGWTLALCYMLDSLITVIPILILIARSKLVLDFALTIHGIHLFLTSCYVRSVPSTIYWWMTFAGSAALMTFLGIWACQWRELKPMAFGGKAKQKPQTQQASAASEVEAEGLLEEMRGRTTRSSTSQAIEMAAVSHKASI